MNPDYEFKIRARVTSISIGKMSKAAVFSAQAIPNETYGIPLPFLSFLFPSLLRSPFSIFKMHSLAGLDPFGSH
jgi:hypothetical protein